MADTVNTENLGAEAPSAAAESEFFIKGLTRDGRQFRPSDWAERLCGVMSCFQPPGARKVDARLRYSPYVRPVFLEGVRSVLVNESLRKLNPMAYHFVLNFAQDNDLQVIHACLLPEVENDLPAASHRLA